MSALRASTLFSVEKKGDKVDLRLDMTQVALDVSFLYENWSPSQKNENICPDRLKYQEERLKESKTIDPIIIQRIDIDSDHTQVYIRTLDGRHRLTAAKKIGLDQIEALIPNRIYEMLVGIFSVKLLASSNISKKTSLNA